MEQRWLALARSYEFAERLSTFVEPFKRGGTTRNDLAADTTDDAVT
jgi:hypothetical protein